MDRLLWTGKNIPAAAAFFERTGGFYFLADGSVELNWGTARARPGDWVRFDAEMDGGMGGFVVMDRVVEIESERGQ